LGKRSISLEFQENHHAAAATGRRTDRIHLHKKKPHPFAGVGLGAFQGAKRKGA
jgi:hypothetical protein